MKLEDGKGTGTLAEVDKDQRLQVQSISSDRAESANNLLEAFVVASPIFAISAATEHRLFYISNGEASRNLIVDLERVFSDGGPTNFDKPVVLRCYLNASIPNVNQVLKDPIGTNTGAGQSSAEFIVWDTVAAGFTQVVGGDLLGESMVALGTTDNRLPSKLILGPAKTLTYSFECVEACDVAIQLYFHLD